MHPTTLDVVPASLKSKISYWKPEEDFKTDGTFWERWHLIFFQHSISFFLSYACLCIKQTTDLNFAAHHSPGWVLKRLSPPWNIRLEFLRVGKGPSVLKNSPCDYQDFQKNTRSWSLIQCIRATKYSKCDFFIWNRWLLYFISIYSYSSICEVMKIKGIYDFTPV